jgi:hypothetical protein
VQATDEAILNAMLAAETMAGANGARVYALPHDRLPGGAPQARAAAVSASGHRPRAVARFAAMLSFH